jgi:hypothetical protein
MHLKRPQQRQAQREAQNKGPMLMRKLTLCVMHN